jgi:hypothetical protein
VITNTGKWEMKKARRRLELILEDSGHELIDDALQLQGLARQIYMECWG